MKINVLTFSKDEHKHFHGCNFETRLATVRASLRAEFAAVRLILVVYNEATIVLIGGLGLHARLVDDVTGEKLVSQKLRMSSYDFDVFDATFL